MGNMALIATKSMLEKIGQHGPYHNTIYARKIWPQGPYHNQIYARKIGHRDLITTKFMLEKLATGTLSQPNLG